ncbi:hypothetical protein BH23ACT5_BH23ACT5_08060 [soil metagenome]
MASDEGPEVDRVDAAEPVDQGEAAEVGSTELDDTPYAVVATVDDMDTARVIVEDLEEHGVPPRSISLLGETVEPATARSRNDVESGAFSKLAKSVIAGGAVGAVVGALIGAVVGLAFPDATLLLSAGLGAVFGAGVGGAAGGMSVAKYSSRAWDETYESVEGGVIAVGVDHADSGVIDAAEEVMRRHPVREISKGRQGDFPA